MMVTPMCSPDSSSALSAISNALRDAGKLTHWRDERLPVVADDGTQVGSIERACVRLLGIRTFAVHLCAHCHVSDTIDAGVPSVWLQRRAANKPVDPGRLDTLAGGLVGTDAGGRIEPLTLALSREIHEEAGLRPNQYGEPTLIQTVRFSQDIDQGFMEEDCVVFHAQVNAGVTPVNLDGEVSEFYQVSQDDLLKKIAAGELTDTAAVSSLLSLKHTAASGG